MIQKAYEFKVEVTRKVRLGYLVHLPTGYGDDPEKKWPLIFFLHGRGERGDDLELLKKHGIAKVVEVDALNALLDEVLDKYNVDEDRVYLTGLSMGGSGSWHLVAAHPDRFAAVAPICGGYGDPLAAPLIKDVPIWVFHGARDTTVALARSQSMVDALKAVGGNVRFTVYPDAEHDSWTQTYDNPELYEWFLQHRRG